MKLVTPLLFGFLVMMTWPMKANAGRWQCPVGVSDPTSGQPNNSGVACFWVEDTPTQSNPGSSSTSGSSPAFDEFAALRNSDYGNSFIAVAIYPNNINDVWASWRQRTEAKATQTALNACTQAMGKGCVLMVKSWNVSTAVVRSQTSLWHASQATPQQAREEALRACRASDRDCEVLHIFVSAPLKQIKTRNNDEYVKFLLHPAFDLSRNYLPKAATNRGFLAIAWTGSSWQTWPNMVVASGYATAEGAENVAIARCQAESKQTCISFGITDSRQTPLFAVYLQGQDNFYWYSDKTEKNLEQRAENRCRELGVTCQKVGVFDARQSSVSIHPIRK